ncbi:mCG1029151, partial [Mus musculus]
EGFVPEARPGSWMVMWRGNEIIKRQSLVANLSRSNLPSSEVLQIVLPPSPETIPNKRSFCPYSEKLPFPLNISEC